jgi:two-component system, sensor histidine kinase and response regulator
MTPIASFAPSVTVDRAILLDRVGGDEELLRELTTIFLDEYPDLMREIEVGLAAGDARRVEHAAHSLKGSVANFGAPDATQAAHGLETLARSGRLSDAPPAFALLVVEFERLRPLLQQLSE